MRSKKLLSRVVRGDLANARFTDVARLLEALGFQLVRISGSHHIWSHPEIPEALNLQDVHGEVKPYQLRQFLRLAKRYNLRLEDD